MSEDSQEIAQLQNEVRALKQAVSNLLVQVQANTQLATALAATHPNGKQALDVFNMIGEHSDATLQYSTMTDDALEQLEQLRAICRNVLAAS